MHPTRTRPVHLGPGGASWNGWTFGPYGKAREFRLIDPDGTTYTAGEIRELARLVVELDYLRGLVREQRTEAGKKAVRLDAGELQLLRAAVAILARALPCDPAGRQIGATIHRLPTAL